MIMDSAPIPVVKFINNKFILATNDPTNPIQIVRQLSSDERNVQVTLSSGEHFEEYLDSHTELVALTGFSSSICSFCLEWTIRFFGDDTGDNEPQTFAESALCVIGAIERARTANESLQLLSIPLIKRSLIKRYVTPTKVDINTEIYCYPYSELVIELRNSLEIEAVVLSRSPEEFLKNANEAYAWFCEWVELNIQQKFMRHKKCRCNFNTKQYDTTCGLDLELDTGVRTMTNSVPPKFSHQLTCTNREKWEHYPQLQFLNDYIDITSTKPVD